MIEELKKDLEFLDNTIIKLGNRSDIWQDRIIYGLAKCLFDVIKFLLKNKI